MSRGNCPYAVESTASLLELILRDTEVIGSSYRPSQQELRLSYSMALIRFALALGLLSRSLIAYRYHAPYQIRQLACGPPPNDLLRSLDGVSCRSARPPPLVC